MASMYDKDPQELIKLAAEALKKDLTMPDWAKFVKTSHANERHPTQPDWYYRRAAAVLRKIYMHGPLGTNKLRRKFSKKKNRGYQPSKSFPASGKIIRTILQQLEKANFITKAAKGVHKGRIVTPKGRKLLDTVVKTKST